MSKDPCIPTKAERAMLMHNECIDDYCQYDAATPGFIHALDVAVKALRVALSVKRLPGASRRYIEQVLDLLDPGALDSE